MRTPLDIILERMRLYDPTEIVDLLKISSEELVDKFYERILESEEFLMGEFEVFVITDDGDQDYDHEWDSNNED